LEPWLFTYLKNRFLGSSTRILNIKPLANENK